MNKTIFFILFSTISSFTHSVSIDQNLLEKANTGDRVSQEEVAKFYEFSGREGEALSWLYKASENGSGYAASKIAKAYYDGSMGLKKNHQEAWSWYKKGASLNNKESLLYMADYYENRNKITALSYLSTCINTLEDQDCLIKYGKLKRSADGNLDENAIKAFQWAAKLNAPEAYTELAFYYENGYIVKKDTDKAYSYIQNAASKNEKNALNKLGNAYLYGNKYGLAKDEKKGLELLEKAGLLGSGDAYSTLGDYYFIDNASPANLNKAIFYYKKSVELNDNHAKWNLAALYTQHFLKSGFDNEYYKKEVASLLKSAADAGSLVAQLTLAEAYDKGYYGLFSKEKSKHYYQLAAKQGSGEAKLKLKGFGEF